MLCPQCGTEMPGTAKFCPKCGQDMTPRPAGASEPGAAPAPTAAPAAPTAPMPQVPPPAMASPPVGYAPPPSSMAPPPGTAPPGPVPPGIPGEPPAKKKKGLIVAIVVIAVLLLCCCGSGGLWYYFGVVKPAQDAAKVKPPTETDDGEESGEEDEGDTDTADDSAEIDAAATVVEDYYNAIAAADMDAIQACLAADVADQMDADWFEGWDSSTTFEFTRGALDGDKVTVYGRESVRAYGSGDDGGVKFTLIKEDGKWRITAWATADRAQIEGSEKTGSSSGAKASLSEASARDLVTRLLEARQAGNSNAVRQLTTEHFQSKYGDIWLDGIPTKEYFPLFEVTGVSISGDVATVTTTEEWISGTESGAYEVVTEGGALLVNEWDSQS